MRRALISVSDKTGIVEIAKELIELGIEIISTGGTYKLLADAGISVLPIEEVTHFPEMLDGRVKTLHPMIHGGLLFRRNDKNHVEAIKKHHISPIDFVIVNLYPFVETIKKENCSLEHAIENIDIGGPSMLRSAAKNHEDVTVVCDLKDAAEMIRQLKEEGETSLDFRRFLAAKVFPFNRRLRCDDCGIPDGRGLSGKNHTYVYESCGFALWGESASESRFLSDKPY
jgi:phosphoribosylaminoimidazolecarboxamide formyltransferase / IMP cyclohydrolase